ncbi:MAG: YcxB family protein [Myxococcota bacterium]
MHEITYEVSTEDIAHLNHHVMERASVVRRRRSLAGAIFAFTGILMFMSVQMTPFTFVFLVAMLTSSMLLASARRAGPSRSLTRYIEQLFADGRNRAVLGVHSMRLLESHVEVSTKFSKSEVQWSGVERVEQDDEHIYVFVGALNAYVINKKYFPTPQDAQSFFQRASRLYDHAMMLEGYSEHRQLPYHAEPRQLPVPQRQLPAPQRQLPGPRTVAGLPGGPGTDGSI